MPDSWKDLLSCLELEVPSAARRHDTDEAQPRHAETDDHHAVPTVFEGRNQRLNYHRLFGGQLLAQLVRAACLSCPDKTVKSLHVLFPRAGRADEPVRYEVTRHHDGGTFATLTVLARQTRGTAAAATVSMHAAEEGPDHQDVSEVPAVPAAEDRVEFDLLPWETRSTVELDTPAAGLPELDLWMRTPPVDLELAPALAAYATDLTLIGTALRPLEGVSQRDAGTAFASAVTSHTVWFHRPFRTDDWLLLRQHSPSLAHARCFGRGDIRTEGGSLVASYAQEALLRFQS